MNFRHATLVSPSGDTLTRRSGLARIEFSGGAAHEKLRPLALRTDIIEPFTERDTREMRAKRSPLLPRGPVAG